MQLENATTSSFYSLNLFDHSRKIIMFIIQYVSKYRRSPLLSVVIVPPKNL